MDVRFMDSLEKKLGYKFNNRKLLEIALTHSSYASEHGKSYEFALQKQCNYTLKAVLLLVQRKNLSR